MSKMLGAAGPPAWESIYPHGFPFQPRFLDVDGRRIAYLDEGNGRKKILLIHGNPVSGYVYDKLLRRLVGDYRCIVPDLLGFGLSEKPPAEKEYSLAGHITIIARFIEILGIKDAVLIGHDWGGPVGFGAAVQQQDRFSHLVFLNTMTEAPMKIMPIYWLPFFLLLRWKRLFAYLVKERNLFQQMGVAIMDSQDQAVYFRANHSPETRAGIAAFPRMIPYKQGHANTPILAGILAQLKAWDIPALVIFSDKDSVFSAGQGERFAVQLRHGRFRKIAGAKHFLQYQRPDEVAAEIRSFLADTGSAPAKEINIGTKQNGTPNDIPLPG